MASVQKGAVSFGLVYIPVELYTATEDNNIRFNQLDKKTHSRVRYRKIAETDGRELKNTDIVKGFEYEKGKYIIIEDNEMEAIKAAKTNSIQILLFTDHCTVSPVYYNKPYYLVSQKGGEKAYELLCRAMLESGKIAIGKAILGQSETLLALIPTDHGILLVTINYFDDIKDFPKESAHPEVSQEELKIARQLIASMEKPFMPEQYHNEYQARLKDLIAQKIGGEEIELPKEKEPSHINNLMDALKASLEQQAGSGKSRRAPRKKAG